MASVLVYIETDADRPSPVSLQALGEGRRIASTLGAVLYAYVPVPESISGDSRDSLVRALGQAGADKVVISKCAEAAGPPLWSGLGPALAETCEELHPVLILLAANALGKQIAPRLAARLGAAFVAEPMIECGPRGEIVFSRAVYGGTHRRRLAGEDLERAVVATLTANAYSPARGDDEADVVCRDCSNSTTSAAARIEHLDTTAEPEDNLDTARVVVIAGGGIDDFASFALLRGLAEALGGEIAATRTLCSKGIAPPEREVGVGARSVAPEILIICAASGSTATLGALAGDAEIIAINSDAQAPVFRVASYGIVGTVESVVPELIAAIHDHQGVPR